MLVKSHSRRSKVKATPPRVGPGRRGISDLLPPPKEFRVDKAERADKIFFETAAMSRSEDLRRSRGLEGSEQLSCVDRSSAAALASDLKRGAELNDPPATLASSLYMREIRIRVTGAVLQVDEEHAGVPRSVFTIIPRGYWLTPEELHAFDLPRATRALRSALNRAGAGQADGALILFLHGEWDEGTDRYQLHYHGWAAGGMVEVVRHLRKQRAYKSTKAARANDVDGVRNRVVVSRRPITDPAFVLSYLTQSFWPARPTGVLPETEHGPGGRFRVRGKRRIPEPQHSQQLVWLHQWRLEDISLLVKTSVVQGRLRLNPNRITHTNRGQ